MSNLGYYQLKSRPGLWKLRLAPGERCAEGRGLLGTRPAGCHASSPHASAAQLPCLLTPGQRGLAATRGPAGRSQELYTIASSTGASSTGQRAEAAVAGADAHQVRPAALGIAIPCAD